jgi:hypothetical protein
MKTCVPFSSLSKDGEENLYRAVGFVNICPAMLQLIFCYSHDSVKQLQIFLL